MVFLCDCEPHQNKLVFSLARVQRLTAHNCTYHNKSTRTYRTIQYSHQETFTITSRHEFSAHAVDMMLLFEIPYWMSSDTLKDVMKSNMPASSYFTQI